MDGEPSLRIDGPLRVFHGDAVVASTPDADDVAPGTTVTRMAAARQSMPST
jgi:hypothetical protein